MSPVPETALVAMSVLVQWSISLLLFLFFVRLGRPDAHRDAVRTWAIAWAIQWVAISGSLVRAVAVLTGDQAAGAAVARGLDLLSIPGTLVFAVLAAIGALQGAGRPVPAASVRLVVLTMGVAGAAIAFINDPMITGSALVGATVAVFFGCAILVGAAERRERPRRFPLLAAAMLVTGAVTLVYQTGMYFGQVVWPLDDFATAVGWSAGYAGALTSLILAGAVITLMMDDAFRGTVATLDPVVHASIAPEVASFIAPVLATAEPDDPAVPEPPVAVMPPPVPANMPLASNDGLFRRRLKRARTATLPRPPAGPNGGLAEVLLVDDEAAVRSTLARIFQRGGWPVRDLSTGEEALAWLLDVPADDAPAVILCEFRMPGMGGREVHAHLLRERPGLVARMVFVTGDASRESAREFIAGTPCPLVETPFMVSEIARAVEQVLAARHPG